MPVHHWCCALCRPHPGEVLPWQVWHLGESAEGLGQGSSAKPASPRAWRVLCRCFLVASITLLQVSCFCKYHTRSNRSSKALWAWLSWCLSSQIITTWLIWLTAGVQIHLSTFLDGFRWARSCKCLCVCVEDPAKTQPYLVSVQSITFPIYFIDVQCVFWGLPHIWLLILYSQGKCWTEIWGDLWPRRRDSGVSKWVGGGNLVWGKESWGLEEKYLREM